MGCASSSIIGDRKDKKKKKEAGLVSQRSVHDRWPAARTNSARTGLAEPALSQKEGESHRGRMGGSLDNFTVGTNDMTTKEDAALDESPSSGDAVLKTSPPSSSAAAGAAQPADDDLPRTSNGFIVRNGVYYSESELAEENIQWQPKYWTPDRIGKWIEDTEFPESIRFLEVRKTILQSSTKKDYRLPETARKMHDHTSASTSAAAVG